MAERQQGDEVNEDWAMERYTKIAQLKSVDAVRERFRQLEIALPIDDHILTEAEKSPLASPLKVASFEVGNRWCIHPMEGWDGNPDGTPSELTFRRWRRFGESGAKLIWGGEAAAVQPDGRANPRQLMAIPPNQSQLHELRKALVDAHIDRFGNDDGLLVGLQLTHSGRFARPDINHPKQLKPRIAFHHPLLDQKFGINPTDASVVWTDQQLEELIENYVIAAKLAWDVGFQFVDIKACHSYLMQEFLSARIRHGRFGGDFEGRTRLLTEVIDRIQHACPELMIGVRLSMFDFLPYEKGRDSDVGQAMDCELPYEYGFGISTDQPANYDLDEPMRLVGLLQQKGVATINLSCGSPYYNPHIQRPAIFPPSDGYNPPEDPLVSVARQLRVAREFKKAFPDLPMVGSGYSYLQDYLPHVAQAAVREGWIDSVGLGRMVLSYHDLPADTLATGSMKRKLICRTFSDCTTAPRNGIISGCFPLDTFYKSRPEATTLRETKAAQ